MLRACTSFRPLVVGSSRYRCFGTATLFAEYDVESTQGERLRVLLDEILPSFCPQTSWAELNRTKGAVKLAMTLRKDLNAIYSVANRSDFNPLSEMDKTTVRDFDRFLKNWLGSCFCVDALELRRITFDHSSGNVLEKVARGESVHRVRSLSELKRRLHNGRRAFALFHYCLPEEPLVFIHVALTSNLATTINELDALKDEVMPSHAMFYSINSPIAALKGTIIDYRLYTIYTMYIHYTLYTKGLDLASFLIKEVVDDLRKTFPSLHTFSTLSPIPSFTHWLRSEAGKKTLEVLEASMTSMTSIDSINLKFALQTITNAITTPVNGIVDKRTVPQLDVDALIATLSNNRDSSVSPLREPLMWAAAHYLSCVSNLPLSLTLTLP